MPSVLDQPTRWPASRAMCAIIREVVVLPLVPVTATTGTFGTDRGGPGAALGRGHVAGGLLDECADVGGAEPVDHRGDRLAESAGAVAVTPGVGDDDAFVLRGRPDAYAEPGGAGLGGDPADEPGHQAGQRPLAEAAHRRVGTHRPDAETFREPAYLGFGGLRQSRHVEGELDGGSREVQVGPLEDPQLDQGGWSL